MRKFSAALFSIVAVGHAAWADWQVVSTSNQPSRIAGIEYRRVGVENSGERAIIDAVLVSPKAARLEVFDNPGGNDTLAEVMRREKCVAGVNGGYFDTAFKPIGLLVSRGRIISPLARARLLKGVLCSSARGIEIVRVGEFSRNRKLDCAIESGPFLVDLGWHVSGLDRTRSARRSFAAVSRDGQAALGICSEVTLDQLASLLSAVPLGGNFKIWRALNLDGGSSSAFWFQGKDDDVISIPEEKTVRDFVAITTK